MSSNPTPMWSDRLTIERTVSPEGTPTLVCRGRITTETGNQFRSEVKSLAPHHKLLLADLSGVDFVDSSGLGAVLATFISAKSNGCDLMLVNVHPRVKDLLDILQLNKVFEGKK